MGQGVDLCEVLESILVEMRLSIKLRRGGGGHGGMTWSTSASEPGGRPGQGRICENAANVYLEVWRIYGHDWKRKVCLEKKGCVSRTNSADDGRLDIRSGDKTGGVDGKP